MNPLIVFCGMEDCLFNEVHNANDNKCRKAHIEINKNKVCTSYCKKEGKKAK